ncbi:MAG: hypothetical protein B7C24_00350 [Bacteroidetes bacterium 4572_77]|nr:MAG: hypothetical protein B7C24_00350 [Bacteroidetes bacterium 4572_77]
MNDILKLKKCPVSGLSISTKPEWKYIADDGSCSIELAIIGDNILYEVPKGIVDDKANTWYTQTANKIIAEYFEDRKYYIAIDYFLLKNATLKAKKIFINWLFSNSDNIELVSVFGMNQIIKVAIKTAKMISKKYEKLHLTNSYEESINAILRKEKSNGILSYHKCPISDLTIRTPKGWEYKSPDGSCSIEMGAIGDAIVFISVVGSISIKTMESTYIILNRIINEHSSNIPLYLIFDYTKLNKESIQAKKSFVRWVLTVVDNTQEILFFGVKNSLKLTITATKTISSKFDKIIICNTYQEAIKRITKGGRGHLNKEKNTRMNELIGYLGKMTWAGDLNQKIPVLPNHDPLAELFSAVAANQEDLREIDNERKEALKTASHQKALVQASEEYYRTLIENSIDSISIIDIKGNNIFRSKTAEGLLGYSNKERINKNALDIILPEDRLIIAQTMKELIESPESLKDIAFRVYHEDGSIRHLEGKAKNMLHSPIINGIVLNYRDVTERINAEQIIQNQNQEYEALNEELNVTNNELQIRENKIQKINSQLAATISALPDLMFETDSKGRIFDYHTSKTALLYDKPENFLGKKIDEILPKDAAIICNKAIKEAIETGTHTGASYSLQLPNGLFWFELSIALKTNNEIQEKRLIILVRDITERKKTEEALRESEKKYQLLTETMKDVVVRISLTGELLYVSPAVEEFGGYKPHEETGSNIAKYFTEESDFQRAAKLITEIVKTQESGSFEFIYKPKNKAPFPVEHTYVPLINNNKVYAIQMVLRDISERKKAEEALKASNKTKDKFFSIIAHDLRSPFNSLLGFSELLNDEYDDFDTNERKKFIGIIYHGLQNALKLLDDDFEKINLFLISKETSELLKQSIDKKSIQLTNQITKSIYVKADRNMLATIIRNLLSNALKFTNKHGEITISTISMPNKKQKEFVTIKVSDTGVGISQEAQAKLFDIGTNISTRGTENEKGTGLGLILCKEFIEMHGGKIWVESEVGKGTSFFFTIPYVS